MMKNIYSIIVGTGSYIPTRRIPNSHFLKNIFYNSSGTQIELPTEQIISKFEKITEIRERRYITDNLVTSDIATFAARNALDSSKIDKETLDYIIVAHNFGDIKSNNRHSDMLPCLAARVKHKLEIKNPKTIAYDINFGCPGWLRGMIEADYYIKSGDAKRIMVIGADTLSRVYDPHDRDSMIYADGAGATILEAKASDKPIGILSHASRTDTIDQAYFLWLDKSYNHNLKGNDLFLKMKGRKLYEYALKNVPSLVKESLDKAKLTVNDITKVLIHQANEKMDEAILKLLLKLYDSKIKIPDLMPMTISDLGNSSVATIPTLLDLLVNKKLDHHELHKGNVVVFASVGAGMNINSMVYRIS